MLVMKAVDICVEIEGKSLFDQASIEIHDGEHIALIGKNGIGKTTFLKTLFNVYPIKKGKINHQIRPEDWGWMEQETIVEKSVTARTFVELERSDLSRLKQELFSAEQQIQATPDSEDAISNYSNQLQMYLDLSGYEWETKVEKALSQVGLTKDLWSVPFQQLSGGQKTRAKLARIITKDPKLLILDEPTNHLDVESIEWLAKWIKSFRGAVLFISHERSFIDDVAHITYELTPEGTKKYQGGYTDYSEQKEHERKTLEAKYQKQESEKRKLMGAISQYKQWFQKAHNSASERDPFAKKKANKNMTRFKAKEMALEHLENEKVEKPKSAPSMNVELEAGVFLSKTMVTFNNVTFSYVKSIILFKEIYFTIEKGDRIAIVGRNGTGKTTLLKLITGHLKPDSGQVVHHPKLQAGYFMQELESLQPESSVLDQILSLPSMTQSNARTILACFLFRGDTVFKKVRDLSMGEKCRVAFVKLYFSEANLLVLDEPTNYLDIETREKMEEALAVYPGSVVTVTHDPYMLDRIANRVLSLDDGQFYDYQGSYQEWKGHVRVSGHQQGLINEIERLKLQRSILITQDIDTTIFEEDELGNKMKEINAHIQRLEQELNQAK